MGEGLRIRQGALSDYKYNVALGRVAGASVWNKFGYQLNVGTTEHPIAEFAAAGPLQFNKTAETLNIVSDNAADALAGTGLQKMIIWGVTTGWAEAIDIVDMDGINPVNSNIPFLGINRISIFKAGTQEENVGKITVTASGTGYTLATMPATQGTSQQTMFYVPAGKTYLADWLLFNGVKTSGGGNPQIEFKGYVYSAVATAKYEIFRDVMETQDEQHIELNPNQPFVVSEKSLLWFTAKSTGANTSVKGRHSGIVQ